MACGWFAWNVLFLFEEIYFVRVGEIPSTKGVGTNTVVRRLWRKFLRSISVEHRFMRCSGVESHEEWLTDIPLLFYLCLDCLILTPSFVGLSPNFLTNPIPCWIECGFYWMHNHMEWVWCVCGMFKIPHM
jgi:hypothetical protein